MVRHRLYRFRRFTYSEYRVGPLYRLMGAGELVYDTERSVSYYWTPLGVWLHPRRMKRAERQLDILLAEAD